LDVTSVKNFLSILKYVFAREYFAMSTCLVCYCAATRFRRLSARTTRGGSSFANALVWQRRGRHRFRSATATARLPGRHDTKAVLAVQRFLRSDAQAAADDAT
jgi:hypothetical protein